MRRLSHERYTPDAIDLNRVDGHWVVIAEWFGQVRVVHDPGVGNDSWYNLRSCINFVKENS